MRMEHKHRWTLILIKTSACRASKTPKTVGVFRADGDIGDVWFVAGQRGRWMAETLIWWLLRAEFGDLPNTKSSSVWDGAFARSLNQQLNIPFKGKSRRAYIHTLMQGEGHAQWWTLAGIWQGSFTAWGFSHLIASICSCAARH